MPRPIVEIFVGCSWAIAALSKIWGLGVVVVVMVALGLLTKTSSKSYVNDIKMTMKNPTADASCQ